MGCADSSTFTVMVLRIATFNPQMCITIRQAAVAWSCAILVRLENASQAPLPIFVTGGITPYVAPERLHQSQCIQESDLWCLGVMSFHLLNGYAPSSAWDGERVTNILGTWFHAPWTGGGAPPKKSGVLRGPCSKSDRRRGRLCKMPWITLGWQKLDH